MPVSPAGDVAAEKRALRREMRALRAARAPGEGAAAARAVCERALAAIDIAPGAAVAGYWPFVDEIDPRPLMDALRARGHALCLPAVVGRDRPLAFRAWEPGDALLPSVFGTVAPAPERPELTPALLLVPLLAFDDALYRLGFGGGYYDRTLAALEATAVGLAFSFQHRPRLPREAHDRPLDLVVTERAVHRAPAGA